MTDSIRPYLSLLPPAALALTAFAVAAFLISYLTVRLLPLLASLGERLFKPSPPLVVMDEVDEGLSYRAYQRAFEVESQMKEWKEINQVRSHIIWALLFALVLWTAAAVIMMTAVGPWIPFRREGMMLPSSLVRYGMLIVVVAISWLAYRWLLKLLTQRIEEHGTD